MLIKPFKQLIEEYHRKKEEQEYEGFVEDNNDPLKLGRIRVRTDLYEDIDVEQLPWAYPTPNFFLGNSKNAISWSVPEVGSQVKVYYPTHDKTAPFYKGMEFNELNKCTFFDVDYPNTYGFKDSRGNFWIVNKKTDITQYQHSSGTNIVINKDGEYTITTPESTSSFNVDSLGNVKLKALSLEVDIVKNVKVNATSINETASNSINVTATEDIVSKAANINNIAVTEITSTAPKIVETATTVAITGNTTITGLVTCVGSLTSTGSITSATSVIGSIVQTSGGIGLGTHVHSVESAPGTTSTPL